MKLCFINPTEMHRMAVYELAKHLVMKKDCQVTILQPSGRHSFSQKMYWKPFHSNNIEIVYFPSVFLRKFYYTLPFFSKEFKILCRLVSDLRCEIIQACEYAYLTSIAPILAKKRYKIPLVLTLGELLGYTWFYGDVIVDTIAKMYTYSIGKWIINSYDQAISLTKKAAEGLRKFGVPKEKISVIPNGVDVEDFRLNSDIGKIRADLSIKSDDKVLLFVGRLAKVKRVEILIALTKSLLKEGLRVKAVIVGDGPKREYYEKLSSSIRKNVIFTGHVARDCVCKYYSLADVFILPSLSEGLPSALLEASATGKPCIASNVGGVPDVIVHEKTGYLVDRLDIRSYLPYVRILLADEDLSREMGRKALKHVRENFSWDVVVDKYEKIYLKALSR